jgi:hypothetical protein
MPKQATPMITITRPGEFQQEYLMETPMPQPLSLRRKLIHKSTTVLRREFTAPLSWSPPQKLPQLSFTPVFKTPQTKLEKLIPTSIKMEDLEQQTKYIDSLIELIDKLCQESSPCTALPIRRDPTFTFENPL